MKSALGLRSQLILVYIVSLGLLLVHCNMSSTTATATTTTPPTKTTTTTDGVHKFEDFNDNITMELEDEDLDEDDEDEAMQDEMPDEGNVEDNLYALFQCNPDQGDDVGEDTKHSMLNEIGCYLSYSSSALSNFLKTFNDELMLEEERQYPKDSNFANNNIDNKPIKPLPYLQPANKPQVQLFKLGPSIKKVVNTFKTKLSNRSNSKPFWWLRSRRGKRDVATTLPWETT